MITTATPGCGGQHPSRASGLGVCLGHDGPFCTDAWGNKWPTEITVEAK